jgi:hypothetical protein
MGRPQKQNDERDRRVEDWLTDTTVFTTATFDCFLDPRTVRFTAEGSMSFGLIVPPGQIPDAISIRHLTRNRLPLSITLKVTDAYTDTLDAQAIASHLTVVDTPADL